MRCRVEARAATDAAALQFPREWHTAYVDDDLGELLMALGRERETWLDYRLVNDDTHEVLFEWPSDGVP